MSAFAINQRTISATHPTYIIAEVSANHNQDFGRAVRIIEAAHESGADAVKLQTYTPDTITIDSDRPEFQIHGTLWDGRNLYDLYGEAYTPWDWQPKLKQVANDLGMDLFSTPFDFSAVDFLEEMNVPAYKIASFENNDLPLIRYVARTGKPIIMSTGMADFSEIQEAVNAIRAEQNDQIVLLKCTSSYPAPPEEANLNTIPHLASSFQVIAGLSDHTMGSVVPVTAVALGARVIEKHFTLSRSDPGPDSAFSMEPQEFRQMIEAVRVAEQALGQVSYGPTEHERRSTIFRRSLFVVEAVRAGEPFTPQNVRSIRPANGLPPKFYDKVIGKTAALDIERGTPLQWEHIRRDSAEDGR